MASASFFPNEGADGWVDRVLLRARGLKINLLLVLPGAFVTSYTRRWQSRFQPLEGDIQIQEIEA